MPAHVVFSLRTPWWTLWGLEHLKEPSPVGAAMRRLWKQKLEAICKERDLDYTEVAYLAGMTYKKLVERRQGVAFGKGSLPLHEVYLLAVALDVEVTQLLPTRRELFTLATTNLIDDYRQSVSYQAGLQLSRAAPSAYVEYQFAKPDRKGHDVLDDAAVARAYQALGGWLASVNETRRTLDAIGRVIDVIIFSLRGKLT